MWRRKKKKQSQYPSLEQQPPQTTAPQRQQPATGFSKVSQGQHTHSSNSLDQEPRTSPSGSADWLAPQPSWSNQSPGEDASPRSRISSGSVKRAVETIERRSPSKTPERKGGSSRTSISSLDRTSSLVDTGRGVASSPYDRHSGSSNSFSKQPSSHSIQSPLGSAASVLRFFSRDAPRLEVGKEKVYEGVDLQLPPLHPSSVRHRTVTAVRNASLGGFGFVLRKSFQPDPGKQDKPLLVHLVEPRPSYVGPLMTGDRIIELNGESVENVPYERVVELIKASGESIQLVVASVPELMELNVRGALDEVETHRPSSLASSGSGSKKKNKPGVGTLRKQNAQRQATGYSQAKSESQVWSEKMALREEMVWVVHREGFALASVVKETQVKNALDITVNLVRMQSKDSLKVKLVESKELLPVDEVDLEKANPPSLDHVEDIIDLVHLNESSVIHVLRQRYASSLIHTFSGRHMIIVNPLRHLSLYSDRVVDMFRGCRREDMPPHIFAMGQQAYRTMLTSHADQSLILMGLSGSGKTFNARYLLRYLASIGQTENGYVTNAKMDAVDMLLHSFSSAATVLNPQATRCTCLYSLEFDPSGSLTAACVRTFVLERSRVAVRPEGERSFNILYHLIAGADEDLRSELMLDASPGTTEPNPYIEPLSESQQIGTSAYTWDLVQNCLHILGISDEEAMGIWSLLAAIYHLGNAGVSHSAGRSSERFSNPAAAQRAALLLGISQEELAKDIFSPPRISTRYATTLSQSPTMSETSSINVSMSSVSMASGSTLTRCSLSMDAFVMGLYEQAFNAFVALINRSLQPSVQPKGRYLIHILDSPGFQQRDLAGISQGASLDDLCFNYAQERLQMLYHDTTFTADQERYLQENIEWAFNEVIFSPLAVIDVIDKHVPQQRRGMGPDLGDRRGLLWLLDDECMSSSDYMFLERIQTIHGEPNEFGESLVQVVHEKNQFIIAHCQQSLPIAYEVTGWLRRAREHPSTRVVFQVLSESKRLCIAALFQGRGVASSGAASIMNKTDSQTTLRMARALSLSSNPTAGVKKASICLQTKFQLDFLMDMLRKTDQWFIRCILPDYPSHLPGAIASSSPSDTRPDHAQHGHMDVPLVRAQLRRADIVPGARIYKQGFPEHLHYPAFQRRYRALLSPEERASLPKDEKMAVEFIISGLEDLDKSMYRLGLSQVFFHAGTLSRLDRKVEAEIHSILVKLQAHCRGYLGRQLREKLDLRHAAARLIQRNVRQADVINGWAWWKLLRKVKPLLAVWKAEEEVKKKDSQIATLKDKLAEVEEERDALKESENKLMDRVSHLTTELQESQLTVEHATDLLEQEQLEKRELEDQWTGMTGSEQELLKRNAELQMQLEEQSMQLAELSILARIKHSEGSRPSSDTQDSETVLEKYWETKRELETVRTRLSADYEDQIDTLKTAKKSLEKKLNDSVSEADDLHRNLALVRKKAAKYSSEMNDLKLQLESQQARNEELERRQRKFDTDLSSAHLMTDAEKKAKDQLQREKDILQLENSSLEQKVEKLKEDCQRLENEKNELEADLIKRGSSDAESEIASLKRMKKELERKVEEVEDDLDEANIKLDSLMQSKTRLDVAIQSAKAQHAKELESRDEDLAQLRTSMTKKLKTLEQQLEEEHEHKQQAIKARRELERELSDVQARHQGNPEVEKKLKKSVKKLKALLLDAQEELQHQRENRSSAATIRSLRTQLEDMEVKDAQSVKLQKRQQAEMEDMQTQLDELTRVKFQLDSQVTELQHLKSDLEARLEEEQDEIEELTGKQRQHISQIATLQQQATESSYEIEELQDAKQAAENKIKELKQKIIELESGVNKQEYEASELKVRELEQKLDLERSTNKRQENAIARLRNQLDRMHEEKAGNVSSHSNEAIQRLHRQMRELREELQELERKEQEQNKKRRAAETQAMEIQAQLTTTQSDLKSAQKRIESLQNALEGQDEEFSTEGEEEEEESRASKKRKPDKKAIGGGGKRQTFSDASSDESYRIGELGSSGSSDDEVMAKLRSRRKFRSSMRAGSSGALGADSDPDKDARAGRHKRSLEVLDVEDELYSKPRRRDHGGENDDNDHQLAADRTRRTKKSELSDEETPRKGKKIDWRALFSDEDDDDVGGKGARGGRVGSRKSSTDDTSRPRKSYWRELFDDDDDIAFDDKEGRTRSKKNHQLSDEDVPRRNWRKKYEISSDDDGVEVKSLNWRAKYNISSSDEGEGRMTTGSSRTASGTALNKRSQQSLLSDDSEDLAPSLMRRKATSASKEDVGDRDGVSKTKTRRTKKAWETSSEEEDKNFVSRRRERSVPLADSDEEDLPLRFRRSREILDAPSDEETIDLPSQPVRKKISFDLKADAAREIMAGRDGDPPDPPSSSAGAKTGEGTMAKDNQPDDASFVASRKRRQRRRSRLSNTDASPKKTVN